jgi:hypothetical protein
LWVPPADFDNYKEADMIRDPVEAVRKFLEAVENEEDAKLVWSS